MGHNTRQRTSSFLIFSIIILLLIAQPYPARAEHVQLDGKQFGPVLFLLSPTADQTGLLPGLPVTFHATLFGQPLDRYIASGEAGAETQIAAAGVDVRVLDTDTTGKVYYFVDTSAENALQLAATYGAMIYGDPLQSLLAAPQAREAALVAELPAAGVPIALLSTDAIVFRQPTVASIAEAVPPAADPAIQALLVQVSETRINDLIADLSGIRAVLINGASVTIPTRYSFSSSITNAEAYVRQHYAGLGLTTRTLPWTYGSYSGRNITVDIPGVIHPERIWLVGGHLDSTSTVPYSTAPGADDNASGTAATLALAEIVHDAHFADTIRFVHFTGEEQGMWGSKVYARDLQISGAQVMGYVNLDMIGWDGDADRTVELHSGTGSPSIALANAFISANERYGQGLRLELKQGTASRFSDHSSFWDYGYSSFLTIENFYDDAIARDRNPWYHTTGDLLSRVDLNYVARSARTALATMAELAGIITGPLPTATPTLTPTLTPTATSTRTPTATPAPGVCQQLIANGGFEATTAWVMPTTAYPAAYSATRAYSGLRSLRAGVDTTPDRYSYSDGYQLVTIPATAATATLRAWWFPRSAEGSLVAAQAETPPPTAIIQALVDGNLPQGVLAGDRQYLLILDSNGTTLATLLWTRNNAQAWSPLTFDLTPYRGRTIQVRFGVYNDGSGQSTSLYLDDVTLDACPANPASPTPTPTATASATPTTTYTPSPTASTTPSATPSLSPTATSPATDSPTPTMTPNATQTHTTTPSPTSTSTSSPTATDTRTPTATPAPGVCQQLIANGGFEATTAWIMPTTAYPAAYSATRAYSGLRSLRAGVDTTPDRYSYSDGYQLVTIPATAATATLRAWWFPRSAEGSLVAAQAETPPPTAIIQALVDGNLPQGVLAGDRQYLLILDSNGTILATLLWTRSDAQAWSPLTFDLTAYRGRTIQVRFGVYNDGSGQSTSLYLDDVTLDACPANPASPTPTPTPTPIGSSNPGAPPLPVAPRIWVPLVMSGVRQEVSP